MAQINYPIRVGSFGYSFLIFVMLLLERGTPLGANALAFPVFALVLYPHLAWLHARIASDSRRAELDNLVFDGAVLGVVAAQAGLALWITGGCLCAVCINNAVCGGARRLVAAVALLVACALGWTLWNGQPTVLGSSPLVGMLCMAGIAAYISAVGLVMHATRDRIARVRDALARSEEQFRFIAEHAGDFIAVLDSRGRIRYASGIHQERFDPHLSTLGAHWTGLIDPGQREQARQFMLSVLRSGRVARMRFRFTAREGMLEMDSAAHVIQEAGESGGHLLVIISHELPSPAAAQAAGGDLRAEGHALLLTSVLGRIEFASPRIFELLGYRAAELIGKSIPEIAEAIPSSDSLLEDVWQSIEIEGRCRRKFLAICKNGQLKLAWASVEPLVGGDGQTGIHYAWTVLEDHSPVASPELAPVPRAIGG